MQKETVQLNKEQREIKITKGLAASEILGESFGDFSCCDDNIKIDIRERRCEGGNSIIFFSTISLSFLLRFPFPLLHLLLFFLLLLLLLLSFLLF